MNKHKEIIESLKESITNNKLSNYIEITGSSNYKDTYLLYLDIKDELSKNVRDIILVENNIVIYLNKNNGNKIGFN